MNGHGWGLLLLLTLFAGSTVGEETVTFSGRISGRGVASLDPAGVDEGPSLIGRLELDVQPAAWRLHSLVVGGWDGAVRNQEEDNLVFRNFTQVFQDHSPFVDFKEVYFQRMAAAVDFRIGIQRFSWGRLDEYPVNDLLNPWDYNRVLIKPLEERKIGVPSVSMEGSRGDWGMQLVWAPWFVPYRLPDPDARWSMVPTTGFSHEAQVFAREPDLPARTFGNGSFGARVRRSDQIDWALNFFHGVDPRPVFRTNVLHVTWVGERLLVDPGVVPTFHPITTLGADGAVILGDWSLRAEAAYTFGRTFNASQELWGLPTMLAPGIFPLNPVEVERDTLDYGIGADYRLIEDWLLTLQAQQTEIFGRPETLYDRERETLLWVNLKVNWLNQRLETNLNLAFNPEHGAAMIRPGISYTFSDTWKVSLNTLLLDGPVQSIFGRFGANDQIELVVTKSW